MNSAAGPPPARTVLADLFAPPASREQWYGGQDEVDYYSFAAFGRGVPERQPADAVAAGAQAVETGDVLLCRLIATPRRAWVVATNHGRLQLASNEWLVLRTRAYDPDYLRHLLVSNDFHLRFMRAVAGGSRSTRAQPARVGAIELPLPPLTAQAGIARALAKVDELRAKRRAVLAAVDALAEAVLVQWFGDPHANPKRWPLKRIAELCTVEAGAGANAPSRVAGGWRVLRAADIAGCRIEASAGEMDSQAADAVAPYAVKDGDLLLVRMLDPAAKLRQAAIAYPGRARWVFHAQLVRLRFDHAGADPEFMRALLSSRGASALLARASRRTRTGFSVEPRALASLPVPLPPLSLQREFARYAESIEQHKRRLHVAAACFDALLGTLRDRAFRGELEIA